MTSLIRNHVDLETALNLDATVVSFMNSYSQGLSGGDVAFLELFKRINPRDHTVVTSELGEQLCRSFGLTASFLVTTTEKVFRHPAPTYVMRIILGLVAIFRVPRPDIIYVSSDILPDVIPAIALKLWSRITGRKSKIFQKTYHVNDSSRRLSSTAQKIGFWLIKLSADTISTCSEYSQEIISTATGIARDEIKVTLLGVDLQKLRSISPSNEVYDAVFLGRIHPSKGIYDLVPVWQKVIQSHPFATLAIIGRGDDAAVSRLKSSIHQAGLTDRVQLMGYLPGDEGLQIMKAAKIFVFPSHEEGFGIAIAEAMALGTPVVAYDLEVYKKAFGAAISTAPCFQDQMLADMVTHLLTSQSERMLIKSKADNLIEKFSLSESAKTEFLFLKNLMPQPPGSRNG